VWALLRPIPTTVVVWSIHFGECDALRNNKTPRSSYPEKNLELESLILAQIERWR